MPTEDSRQNYYFHDYQGVRHYADSREDAESLREKVGGGYVVYEIERKPTSRTWLYSKSDPYESFKNSVSSYPPYPAIPKDGKISFFLCDYGKIGMRAKASSKTAHLLCLLLAQRPLRVLGPCTLESADFEISLDPIFDEDILVHGKFSYSTAKLLWSFVTLLEAECIYRDAWDIENGLPFEEWKLWAHGVDPIDFAVSVDAEEDSWYTNKSVAPALPLWDFHEDETPAEALEDLALSREWSLSDDDIVNGNYQPSRIEEEINRCEGDSRMPHGIYNDNESSDCFSYYKEDDLMNYTCSNGVVVRAHRRILASLIANTNLSDKSRIFSPRERSSIPRLFTPSLGSESAIKPEDCDFFDDQCHPAEVRALILEDAAAAWEETREAEDSRMQLPDDESEDYGWDSSEEGDLDNFWNTEGRLEEAINDISDSIERRLDERANEAAEWINDGE